MALFARGAPALAGADARHAGTARRCPVFASCEHRSCCAANAVAARVRSDRSIRRSGGPESAAAAMGRDDIGRRADRRARIASIVVEGAGLAAGRGAQPRSCVTVLARERGARGRRGRRSPRRGCRCGCGCRSGRGCRPSLRVRVRVNRGRSGSSQGALLVVFVALHLNTSHAAESLAPRRGERRKARAPKRATHQKHSRTT